jgi:hypothetical protein
LEKLLTLDPAKRLTAAEAMDHDYFWRVVTCKPREYVVLSSGVTSISFTYANAFYDLTACQSLGFRRRMNTSRRSATMKRLRQQPQLHPKEAIRAEMFVPVTIAVPLKAIPDLPITTQTRAAIEDGTTTAATETVVVTTTSIVTVIRATGRDRENATASGNGPENEEKSVPTIAAGTHNWTSRPLSTRTVNTKRDALKLVKIPESFSRG